MWKSRERVTAEHVGFSEAKWGAFVIGDICDVNSGRDIYAAERKPGDTPYVTSGVANNGVGYFVGNDNDSLSAGSISVNRNGAVGMAFYHPYKALYGNDCRRLTIKETDSPFASLFLTQCIAAQKNAFSYSRKLGTARLKRLRVMLPVNSSGEPDWKFMDGRIREREIIQLRRIQTFLNRQVTEIEEE